MNEPPPRPRVRIRFRYNVDTGTVEEFLVDDNAPDRSESYHDRVADAIASQLIRRPAIEDAGPIRQQTAVPGGERGSKESGDRDVQTTGE
jgi:hypothetical protein